MANWESGYRWSQQQQDKQNPDYGDGGSSGPYSGRNNNNESGFPNPAQQQEAGYPDQQHQGRMPNNYPSSNPQQNPAEFSYPPQRRQRRELTFEEKQVVQQCGKEAKLYRGLPLAAASLAGMLALKNFGYVQPRMFWLKTASVASVSYFFGTGSYVWGVCRERIMRQIPNSPMAQDLKKAFSQNTQIGDLYADAQIRDRTASEVSTGIPGFRHDDGYYPGMIKDTPMQSPNTEPPTDEENVQKSRATSYDDLRRKNREDFVRNMRPPLGYPTRYQPSSPRDEQDTGYSQASGNGNDNPVRNRSQTGNRYGDAGVSDVPS